jgi:hypothetical protein
VPHLFWDGTELWETAYERTPYLMPNTIRKLQPRARKGNDLGLKLFISFKDLGGIDNFRCDFGLMVIGAKSLQPNIIGESM